MENLDPKNKTEEVVDVKEENTAKSGITRRRKKKKRGCGCGKKRR